MGTITTKKSDGITYTELAMAYAMVGTYGHFLLEKNVSIIETLRSSARQEE